MNLRIYLVCFFFIMSCNCICFADEPSDKKSDLNMNPFKALGIKPSAEKNPFVFGPVPTGNKTVEKKSPETKTPQNKPILSQPSPPAQNHLIKENEKVHVELTADNLDLYVLLDEYLYKLFGVYYIVDPYIKATVTFHINGDFTRAEFIAILNDVLQLNNLSIVKGPGNLYKVVRRETGPGFGHVPLSKKDDVVPAGDVTRMIRLRYLSSSNAMNKIRPFLSKGANVLAEPLNNSLIITDTPENIDKAFGILEALDDPYFEEVVWRLFPVKYADSKDIANDLNSIFKASNLYRRQGMDRENFKILPIKSVNAVLVVSDWSGIFPLAEEWVNKLDYKDEAGTKVNVYFVENGMAKDIADILKQLYGGKPSSSNSQKKTIVDQKDKPNEPKPEPSVDISGSSGDLTGEVTIIADETTNSIVIKANSRDYSLILEVLKQIDIVPRQVLINVVVIEVTLSRGNDYGIHWLFDTSLNGNKGYTGLTNTIAKDSTGNYIINGAGWGIMDKDIPNFVRAMILMLDKESTVNILSSPNILAVDNKEAKIEVGEDVPTLTGQLGESSISYSSTFQYKKTGILLTVTPHINSSGLVKMEVKQEVSDKGEFDKELNNWSFLNRTVETSMVVQDGQTIIIAGLMKTNQSLSNSGIPFLKDIPVLGYLFKGEKTENKKTELVILITPRLVNNRNDADRITREFSEKIGQLKGNID
ncbi:MAG: type II secretion system secretin GspD [Desulfobacterales bacterium]|nr:type II secretion system secretin GspD [Desulfobacterales bacterium]